jgi:predicted nucleic acid-binding Zn ribbon protein
LRDLWGEVGARAGLDEAVDVGVVWGSWRATVGDAIADHAEPSSLRTGVLRVRADSPAWATEISYLRDEILIKVNERLGKTVVREVRVWTGPGSLGARAGHQVEVGASAPPPRPREVPRDPFTALRRAQDAWSRWRRKES